MESCTGYLFVHFTGEEKLGEQIYFALSRDGLHWMDLNNGNPVLLSDIGEKGVRDPFILRNPLNGRYVIIATDLRIEAGKGWKAAEEAGSRGSRQQESHRMGVGGSDSLGRPLQPRGWNPRGGVCMGTGSNFG